MIVFIIFLLFLGFSSYFIVTQVITQAIKIIHNSPVYVNEITKAWFRIEGELRLAAKDLPKVFVNQISIQVQQYLYNLRMDLLKFININNLRSILTNIPNFFINFLIYLIALFMILLEIPKMKENLFQHMTEKTENKVSFLSSRLFFVTVGFFKAQLLMGVIIFLVSIIYLLFIAPEIALILSLLISLIDFIPFIGSILVLGPLALFQFLTGDLAYGTQLIILAILLIIIRRTIEPKIMGNHIGLSPLSTLVTMYLGYQLLGILGIIIGPIILIGFYSAKEAGIIKLNFKI